jgi:hypothetical protein
MVITHYEAEFGITPSKVWEGVEDRGRGRNRGRGRLNL